jgi:hypothetical protein
MTLWGGGVIDWHAVKRRVGSELDPDYIGLPQLEPVLLDHATFLGLFAAAENWLDASPRLDQLRADA